MTSRNQHWDPSQYSSTAPFVAERGRFMARQLGIQRGDRVLDIGCGDGVLTEFLQQEAEGVSVLGIDSSEEMLEAARQRGIEVAHMDAQQMTFHEEFDKVFSNSAIHWMKRDPEKVVSGIFHALKPGGRFAAQFGGEGNIKSIRNAIHESLRDRNVSADAVDPWYFPSSAEYSDLLLNAGFRVLMAELVDVPTPVEAGVSEWVRTFGKVFINAVSDPTQFVADIEKRVASTACEPHGVPVIDYVGLRVLAEKQE